MIRSALLSAAIAALVAATSPVQAADPAASGPGGTSPNETRKGGTGKGAPPDAAMIRLPAPPFTARREPGVPRLAGGQSIPRLRLLRTIPHKDWGGDAPFRARYGLPNPQVDPSARPQFVPSRFGGRPARAVIAYGRDYLAAYGRILLGFEGATGRKNLAFDFSDWGTAPDRRHTPMQVTWAQRVGDVLYVAHAYNGYAKASRGRNGYISALELPQGRLLWRSRPLVANSRNFLVVAGAIITGYGFTAEPDYLFVLDRNNGAVLQRIRLKTGPASLYRKGDRLYVSAYSEYYILSIVSR